VSQRPPVDRGRIEAFLEALGRETDVPGRVDLVGGSTLVFAGLRAQTLDVDIAYEVSPADHGRFITAVRRLKDRMGINVEEASPADFIPLPAGYRDRAPFVGRFGRLDVFLFDPYSTALSKIERGREEDFADVLSMLTVGWLDWDRLDAAFREILPRMATESLKSEPEDFARRFEAFAAKWRDLRGPVPPTT
jgi:hypothetical protein